jgi:protein subunit release factor B
MTGKITIEQEWYQQSEDAKNEAKNLPQGKDREALIRKAGSYMLPRKSMNGSYRQGYGRRSKKAVCDLILDLAYRPYGCFCSR